MDPLSDQDCRDKFIELFETYSHQFKPLLAAVESQMEVLPAEILNEMRSFLDHISRCFWQDSTKAHCLENLEKAYGHLKRAMLDCMKWSLVYFNDEMKHFDHSYRKVDLSVVNNGRFIPEYWAMRKQALLETKRAKQMETREHDAKVFEQYQQALNTHYALHDFLTGNMVHLQGAKSRMTFTRSQAIGGVILSVLAGVFIEWVVDLVGLKPFIISFVKNIISHLS